MAPTLCVAAWDVGLRSVGENKVQEALAKMEEVSVPVSWHLIGHLQRNKAKFTPRFALIHSMDSPRLADAIDAVGVREGQRTRIRVLAQVNASGEETKGGYSLEALRADAERLARPAWHRGGRRHDHGAVRRRRAGVAGNISSGRSPRVRRCARRGIRPSELSMGMSE